MLDGRKKRAVRKVDVKKNVWNHLLLYCPEYLGVESILEI